LARVQHAAALRCAPALNTPVPVTPHRAELARCRAVCGDAVPAVNCAGRLHAAAG
jgi:hypothetical protein